MLLTKLSKRQSYWAIGAVVIISGVALSGCLNVFSPLDHPTSDPQLLSKARACFDQNDYTCAQTYYNELSSSNADVKTSESAFLVLAQQGAGMKAVMNFVANLTDLDTGKALTIFANSLIGTAGLSSRETMWNAYISYKNISDPNLASFTRFIGDISLIAEILAEGAGTGASLTQSDIAATPSTCSSASCAVAATCDGPGSATLVTASAPSITSAEPTNTNPTIHQLYDLVVDASTALTNLSTSGKFSNVFGDFNTIENEITQYGETALDTQNGPADRCMRQTLLSLDIGLSQ